VTREFSAGGVLVRVVRGRPMLAAIRPRGKPQGLWALPKGNIDAGEAAAETAVREVLEETGVEGELVRELPSTSYVDARGRPKTVRYWLMRPLDERGVEPTEEIDAARWVSVPEAERLLTYARDLEPLRAATERIEIVLLRHARAGDREAWEGDDTLRPLDEIGRRKAEDLVEALVGRRLRRVVSSPYVRCVQTVEPLARELRAPVERAGELAEGAARAETMRLLESTREPTVFCTHGDVVENVLGRPLKKGAAMVLALDGLDVKPVAPL
jgi:8-oxo-dGTP diphosphatase